MLTFVYCTLTPSQILSQRHVHLCLRNSIVCFGFLTKVPGRCYMRYRLEKGKHWECCAEMGFAA